MAGMALPLSVIIVATDGTEARWRGSNLSVFFLFSWIYYGVDRYSLRLAAYSRVAPGLAPRGIGTLEAPLPRMLRKTNYVGASHGSPFRPKTGGSSLAIDDFRLSDRSLTLTTPEVMALFDDPLGDDMPCCVVSGVRSPFGFGNVDLTPQAMGVVVTSKPVAVVVSSQAPGSEVRISGDNPEE